MRISIEIPAFKGRFLLEAVASVVRQTSPDWGLSVLWDGGDALARTIVEELDRLQNPQIHGYIGHRRGIANARRFLTERSTAEWILPLDDDDLLAPDAVESFLRAARQRPWAGIIRARRAFIDEQAQPVAMADWFPFEPRHYQHGMTTDLFNHCQPALIRRGAYAKTAGWHGFRDYHYAGEDCDIFVRIEEVAPIELHDRVLYHYRLNAQRTSLEIGPASAKEMWRRLADAAIARLGLPLRRLNDEPPFQYARTARPPLSLEDIEFIVAGAQDAGTVRRALRNAGVSDYAIRLCPQPGAQAWNDAVRLSAYPAMCFLPAGAEPTRADIEALLAVFCANALDLALRNAACDPCPFLLVRREVLRATGGFDASFLNPELAMLDLCLKASERDFSCLADSLPIGPILDGAQVRADALDYFIARWHLDSARCAALANG
jgi:hypothetical protein